MCGGTAQTTQQVSIPPEVMQNYRAVNARATEVAATPFRQYSTDPNAFVAPINQAQQTGMNAISAAGGVAQPYFQGATQQLMGGQAAATPYYGEATQQLLGGLNAGVTGTQAAYQPLQQGAQAAQGLQGGAYNQYQNALQSSQPYNQAAGQYAQAGLGAATPYYGQAAQNITGAQDVGGALGGASLSSLQQAGQAAQPLQGNAAGNINSAASAAQPLNQAAIRSIMQGNRAAQPLQQQAAAGLGAAQAGAQPYQQLATNFGLSGSQAVNAGPLGGEQINQYMSPYLDSVVGSTMANLRQQQGQEQSSLVGNQVAQGAFGGDRGRLAQANLARQQGLATGQTVAGLMNQGYGQALGAAQQQQQLGLGAAQANRAAQQQASQQMLGIGQQGFGQGMATAQQQAALGQQLYGQGIGSGQALAGIGQQQYGQQMGTGQAQAALGSQLFGQGAQTAQQQAAMGQQLYGQGMGAASAQQGLGQGLYGMGTGMGGFMQGLGQQNYAQQSGLGQNLAQLGQQTFGQGAAQSGQQAALAQQQYGMGAGAAGQMAGLGQGLYGMGAGTSQALAGMGTQAQQNALAAGQAQLGAGTVAQQTQQAGQTALYNQFLQEQGFPYQQAQFLANIAMGTGALSGSTTNTTQAAPFFSDKRLKEAVEPIGKTFDGQKIVKFRYKNEPGTRIGLIAQDVEKHHPDAVGLAGGYKTVDYDAATKDAASKGHYASGGLAPESDGGAVLPAMMRHGFAEGGNPAQLIGNDQLAAILQAQFGMYNNQGIPGLGGAPGMTGFVPEGTLPVGNLTVAEAPPALPESQLKGMIEAAGGVEKAYDTGKQAVEKIKGLYNKEDDSPKDEYEHYRGGLVGHYASGGASSGPYGIPISKAETPELITAGDAPEFQKSGFLKMLDTAGDLASLGSQAASASSKSKAAGGAAEDDVGAGTPYDAGSNPFMPDSAKGIEKKELAKPGAAPGAPESGFSQAMSAANSVAKIAALAMKLNRGGRTGYANGGVGDEEELNYPTQKGGIPSPTPVEAKELPAPGAYSALSPAEKVAFNARMDAQLNAAGNNREAPQGGAAFSEVQPPPAQRLNSYINQAKNVVPGLVVTSGYRTPEHNTRVGGVRNSAHLTHDAFDVAPIKGMTLEQQASAIMKGIPGAKTLVEGRGAKNSTGPHVHVRTPPGLAPSPNAATATAGVAPAAPAASVTPTAPPDGLAGRQYAQANTGNMSDAAPAGLQPSSRVPMPKPDIEAGPYNKTERWLLPLLAGLGDMAGSSNRYGLGALAEGIGGGASAYARMQEKQYSKGQEQQSKGIEAQEAQTGTTQAQNTARQIDLQILQMIQGNLEFTKLPNGDYVVIDKLGTRRVLSPEEANALKMRMYRLGGGDLEKFGEVSLASGSANPPPAGAASSADTPSQPPDQGVQTPVKLPQVPDIQSSPGVPKVAGVPVTSVQINEGNIPPSYRPSMLNADEAKAQRLLNDSNDTRLSMDQRNAFKSQGEALMQSVTQRRAALNSGNVSGVDGQPIAQVQILRQQLETNTKVNQTIPDIMTAVQNQRLGLNNMAKVMQNVETGISSPFRRVGSQIASALSVGSGDEASNLQIIDKEKVNSIASALDNAATNLGSGIGVLNKIDASTFGPTLEPSANKFVLARLYGSANYIQSLADAQLAAYRINPQYDRSQFVKEWTAKNPIDAFEKAAYKNLAVLGASPSYSPMDNKGWAKEASEHGVGGLYIIPATQMDTKKNTKVRLVGFKNGEPLLREVSGE